MSKFGLALIAITAISVVMATHAYYIQAADAQAKLPNNSVSSETIVNGQVKTDDLATDAVTNPKIATDAVTSPEIKNGEVTSADIKDATITSTDIAPGTIPPGGGGTPEVHRVQGETVTLAPGEAKSASAQCPPGELVTGGGYSVSDVDVYESLPSTVDTWAASGVGDETTGGFFLAFALCLGPSP